MEDGDMLSVSDVGDLMAALRGIALNMLANEHNAGSLQPSDLIQTYFRRYKVSDQKWDEITWETRDHFFKSATMMMRRALIDHARKRRVRPQLEGVEEEEFDFYNLPLAVEQTPEQIIALDEAIEWLEEYDSELAQVVEYHYFFGYTVKELTAVLEVAERTVKRRLNSARMLLKKRMEASKSSAD